MKRICVVALAVIMMIGLGIVSSNAYNPYAPNQFESMDRNTWEYQYLYDLTKEGVTGASMGKFATTYTLTRYEMAQMVETAIQRRAKTTAAQQEKIDRLAQAFASDLQYMNPAPTTTEPQGQTIEWRHEGGNA